MDIRNMRQLVAIRQAGSFAKAADALGMSHPSLSSAVARMEDQLKVRLFERTSTGSELTPIGDLIVERAGKVIAEAEALVRDAELAAVGEGGTVGLGVGPALRPAFISLFMRRIVEQYPKLRLHVQVLDRDKLLPLLRARTLDLVICGVEGSDTAGLDATQVLTSEFRAVAAPDHPLAKAGAITLEDFARYPSAGSSAPGFRNTDLMAGLAGADVDLGAVGRYEANDYTPLLAIALSGQCTMMAPTFVIQPSLASGELVVLDLPWSLRVSASAVTTPAAGHSPIIRRLIALAREVGEAVSGG